MDFRESFRPMNRPNVLCVAGHDPSGGAGIHADIEAVAAQGAHALTLITALTVQDTTNVQRVQAVAPALLAQQAECLLDDCQVAAVKLGLLGDLRQIPLIVDWLRRLAAPVVVDPVLRAGGGAELLGRALVAALREQIFPLTTVLTPNAAEARRLTGEEALEAAGAALLECGVSNVLITGGDEPGDEVRDLWFRHGGGPVEFLSPRVPGRFHGTGCTLASALAARLALGEPTGPAIAGAREFVRQALLRAHRPGQGRQVPGRNRVGQGSP